MSCKDYIHALEEERRKIQVFQRELPLSLEIVTQAIEACKQRVSGSSQSDCSSDQTSSDGPILEEFIPLKRDSSFSEKDAVDDAQNCCEKSEWLRSVQLWNQSPDPPTDSNQNSPVFQAKTNGAFHPFDKYKDGGRTAAPEVSADSSPEKGGGKRKQAKDERKTRRCWSPELHKRFLNALQQLGGSHMATPKQIREMMKVDGLTNDEVKSHLQKYRLHSTRRPTNTSPPATTPPVQTHQVVVVGGIWVPPEFPSSTAAVESGIYAPIAKHPPPLTRSDNNSEGAESHSPT